MMPLTETQSDALVAAALAARQRAYAPYSKFQVGAALLTTGGQIFRGCNVENSSYGLTLCAERNAVTTMIAEGEDEIIGMAIVTSGAGTPCGACRQVMIEFGDDFPVLLVDADTQRVTRTWKMHELLPSAFRFRRGTA